MRFIFPLLFALSLVIFPTMVLADAQTGTCLNGETDVVSSAQAGVFMAGICTECWEQGNCSLNDILTVVASTVNYLLSIVAGLVFLVYILGGFFWITSHGDKAGVTKGKKWITNATVGLIIVLVAYTAVVVLRSAITGQGEGITSGYIICSGTDTDGAQCGPGLFCSGYSCATTCENNGGSCVDETTSSNQSLFPIYSYTCAVNNTCTDETQACCIPIDPL